MFKNVLFVSYLIHNIRERLRVSYNAIIGTLIDFLFKLLHNLLLSLDINQDIYKIIKYKRKINALVDFPVDIPIDMSSKAERRERLLTMATGGIPRFFDKNEATEYEIKMGLPHGTCYMERPPFVDNDKAFAEQYGLPSPNKRSLSHKRKKEIARLAKLQ